MYNVAWVSACVRVCLPAYVRRVRAVRMRCVRVCVCVVPDDSSMEGTRHDSLWACALTTDIVAGSALYVAQSTGFVDL